MGTLLSDDPRLTTRLVEGPSPRAVVVDSSLRTSAAAGLKWFGAHRPTVLTTEEALEDDVGEGGVGWRTENGGVRRSWMVGLVRTHQVECSFC